MRISPFVLIKMSLLGMKRHWIRSSLALLGIVIGIASMTITMAIGEGASERIRQDFLSMGDQWIYVVPGNFLSRAEVSRVKKREKRLDLSDYTSLAHTFSSIKAITPGVRAKKIAKYQDHQLVAQIEGYQSDFFRIESRGLAKGASFTPHHDQSASEVAVLGSEVAKELFPKENPIGKTILIDQSPFSVIGVFNEAPKRINQISNPNVNIVIPFSSSRKKVLASDSGESIHEIILKPKDGIDSTRLVSSIRRHLRFLHGLEDGASDDFTIWDLQAMMNAATESSRTFNQFLSIAAGISLLVGGIGIMNMMLVAMTERKKEIGIKMAIGAAPVHILSQFLIESIALCLVGGIIGIATGVAGAYALGRMTDFDWVIRQQPILIALSTTVFVGLFFGFYPSYKASRLNPVEALRSI